MGKGGGTNTVQESADPWEPQQPYLEYGFGQAQDIYQNGRPQYAPFPTYTPMSPQTQAGVGMLEGRSLEGSPVQSSAQGWATNALSGGAQNPYGMAGIGGGFNAMGQGMSGGMGLPQASNYFANTPDRDMLRSTAQGDFLNSNPYIDQTYQNAMESIMPNINATFGSGGRTGGGLHGQALGKAAGQLGADLYGQNYMNERGLMQGAQNTLTGMGMQGAQAGMGAYQQGLGNQISGGNAMAGIGAGLYGQDQTQMARAGALAPQLAGMDYTDIGAMLQAGGITQNQANNVLGDAVNRWDFGQTGAGSDQAALQNYIAAIQGNYGGTMEQQSGSGGSGTEQALGGAMSGAATGSMFGPWGALIGGGVGALSTLF